MSPRTTGEALATVASQVESPPRSGWRHSVEQRALVVLLAADAVSVLLAYVTAFLVRIWVPLPLTAHLLPPHLFDGPHSALAVALVTQFPLLYFFGLYDMRLLRLELSLFAAPLLAVGTQLLVVAGWYFFRGDEVSFPRSVLVIFAVVNFGLVVASRLGVRSVLRKGGRVLRVALVGRPKEVAELGWVLREASASGHAIEVVGAIRVEGFGP